MRRRTTWLVAAVAAGGLVAAGRDAWDAPALRATVAANRREEARLTGEIADVRDDIVLKERLTDELIAGRLTLADATDRFGALLEARPRVLAGLRCTYPDAATDRERAARHVIDYARSHLTDAADKARFGARLTAEWGALFPADRHPIG